MNPTTQCPVPWEWKRLSWDSHLSPPHVYPKSVSHPSFSLDGWDLPRVPHMYHPQIAPKPGMLSHPTVPCGDRLISVTKNKFVSF